MNMNHMILKGRRRISFRRRYYLVMIRHKKNPQQQNGRLHQHYDHRRLFVRRMIQRCQYENDDVEEIMRFGW